MEGPASPGAAVWSPTPRRRRSVSRFFDAVRRADESRLRPRENPRPPTPGELPREQRPCRVLAVVSNKGGVGKTTLATNLAVYLRAMREDLPILLIGLDDQ